MLTATPRSYGKGQISTPHKIKTPERIGIKFGAVDYVPCSSTGSSPTYHLQRGVVTYKTRSAGTPAYLFHLIHDYLPAHITIVRHIVTFSTADAANVLQFYRAST